MRNWAVFAMALGLVPLGASVALACGGFFSSRVVIERSPEQRPSLSREKVLIVHDGQRQHFVREVAFERGDEPFGFVVPVPTLPEVESVQRQPFTKLRDRFPFTSWGLGGIGAGYGRGSGGGFGEPDGDGVEVIASKKVGSFDAAIVSATDPKALATWLATNELVSTPEADVWLAHYVRMGFYYVAMRYEPPPGNNSGAVDSETIRISFDTPIGYYPYFEPESKVPKSTRLLELWFVSTEQVVPVALREGEGERRWLSPFEEGATAKQARPALKSLFADELDALLPSGDLYVQTFQDQKFSRSGWGDVLFALKKGQTLDESRRAALRPLLGILDPELRPTEPTP